MARYGTGALRGGLLMMAGMCACWACDGTQAQLVTFEAASQAGANGADREAGAPVGSGGGTGWSSPPLNADFQVQLSGGLELAAAPGFMVIDLHSPSAEDFSELASQGSYVACYFSAGSFEPWRDDAADFPEASLGEPLDDYPNEQWLDISRGDVRALMSGRISVAAERGCDAVYPSLVRPVLGESQFALGVDDYSDYAAWLATEAHSQGLGALYAGGVAFDEAARNYDGALVFGCVSAGGCLGWVDYASAGAGIYLVEFEEELGGGALCDRERPENWPLVIKQPELGAPRLSCN